MPRPARQSKTQQTSTSVSAETPSAPIKRRWAFEEGFQVTSQKQLSKQRDEDRKIYSDPVGYLSGNFSGGDDHHDKKEKTDQKELVYKSAMAVGTGVGKNLLMTAFMLWMSGSSIQIFSIMLTVMAFWTPIQGLMNVNQAFAKYKNTGVDVTLPKIVYVCMNLLGIGLGMYKCQTMGLLPTAAADWASSEVKRGIETSVGAVMSLF